MSVSFSFQHRLGAGYFGEVWLATDTGLNAEVALKCIPPAKVINQGNFFQEAQVLKASEHPNIVRVHETGELEDGRVYVSMEYLAAGSIEDDAQGAPVPLSRARRLMVDVLRGLGHAHSKGIVHRDVKPANILIGRAGEAKLSDFGLALPSISSVDFSKLKQYQYTLHLAPEVRRPQDYTHLSDIYACGVTLYRLVNGDASLSSVDASQAQALARVGQFPPRDGYRYFIPPAMRRVINKAMSVDPAARYQSADRMRRALEGQATCVDWAETVQHGRSVWSATDANSVCYEVTKSQCSDRTWSVETRKGRSAGKLRRIRKYCHSAMPEAEADRQARKILQSFVMGRA